MQASIRHTLQLNHDPLTPTNVVRLAMHSQEDYSAHSRHLTGAEKKDGIKDASQVVVAQALAMGLIDEEQSMKLHNFFDQADELVSDIVETLISVSKDPSFIQFREQATACFARCKAGSRARSQGRE